LDAAHRKAAAAHVDAGIPLADSGVLQQDEDVAVSGEAGAVLEQPDGRMAGADEDCVAPALGETLRTAGFEQGKLFRGEAPEKEARSRPDGPPATRQRRTAAGAPSQNGRRQGYFA
jgi:hypothetical protein